MGEHAAAAAAGPARPGLAAPPHPPGTAKLSQAAALLHCRSAELTWARRKSASSAASHSARSSARSRRTCAAQVAYFRSSDLGCGGSSRKARAGAGEPTMQPTQLPHVPLDQRWCASATRAAARGPAWRIAAGARPWRPPPPARPRANLVECRAGENSSGGSGGGGGGGGGGSAPGCSPGPGRASAIWAGPVHRTCASAALPATGARCSGEGQ